MWKEPSVGPKNMLLLVLPYCRKNYEYSKQRVEVIFRFGGRPLLATHSVITAHVGEFISSASNQNDSVEF